jgi:hypothetical protein
MLFLAFVGRTWRKCRPHSNCLFSLPHGWVITSSFWADRPPFVLAIGEMLGSEQRDQLVDAVPSTVPPRTLINAEHGDRLLRSRVWTSVTKQLFSQTLRFEVIEIGVWSERRSLRLYRWSRAPSTTSASAIENSLEQNPSGVFARSPIGGSAAVRKIRHIEGDSRMCFGGDHVNVIHAVRGRA